MQTKPTLSKGDSIVADKADTKATPATAETAPTVDMAKPLGLILNLGNGTPFSPHTVVGVRGQYRPDRAVPIGAPGELSLEEAIAAVNSGAPLQLVNLPKNKVDELRALALEDLANARRGAVQARQDGLEGAEVAALSDHLDAVKDTSNNG